MRISSFFFLTVIFSLIILSNQKKVYECGQEFTKQQMECSKIINDLIKNMKCVVKAEEKYVECLEKAPDYPKIP